MLKITMQVKWPSWDQGPELLIPKCVLFTRLLPTVHEEQGRTDQKGLGKDDREQRAEWGEAPTAASWPCPFAWTKRAFLIGDAYGWSDLDHTAMERPPWPENAFLSPTMPTTAMEAAFPLRSA